MSVEQHLMRLQKISPDQKGAAMRQLDVGNLQLDTLAANIGPVLAPVELKCLAWRKHQRNKSSPISRMMRPLAFALPFPHEGRNTLIGTFISQLHQIGVHQLRRSAILA